MVQTARYRSLKGCTQACMTIRLIGNDTIKQEWLMYQDGKPEESTTFSSKG